jgi:hypothetical protein
MPSLIPEKIDNPGTHVFVIGVSAYKHLSGGTEPSENADLLGMKQLSAAARSASEFAAWVRDEYHNPSVPLSSLRVLLSPSPGESIHPRIAELQNDRTTATLENVERELVEFRKACDRHPESIAVVYIAGHGVQLSKHGSIVLLHDCGSDDHSTLLKGAINVAGVHAGFNHPETAQTQFWFVDACRQVPYVAVRFEQMEGGLTLDVRKGGTAGTTALFLGAATDSPAYGCKNGVTLFNEALMGGLRGKIAESPKKGVSQHWTVTTFELAKQLPARLEYLARKHGVEQTVDPAGRLINAVFHTYQKTPIADLTIALSPMEQAQGCVGCLRNGALKTVVQGVRDWPMTQRLEAGIYTIEVVTPGHAYDRAESLGLTPPSLDHTVELVP